MYLYTRVRYTHNIRRCRRRASRARVARVINKSRRHAAPTRARACYTRERESLPVPSSPFEIHSL